MNNLPHKYREIFVKVTTATEPNGSLMGVIVLKDNVWIPDSVFANPLARYYVDLWCEYLNNPNNINFKEVPQEEYVYVGILPNTTLGNKHQICMGYMYTTKQDEYYFDSSLGTIALTPTQVNMCHQKAREITERLKSFWK